MSTASKVGQVVFSQKAGIYMPAVVCDKGDLYQEYDGDVSAPVNVAPDFSVMKPVLSYILTSSRVAEGVVVPSSVNGISMTLRFYSRGMYPQIHSVVRQGISSLSLIRQV